MLILLMSLCLIQVAHFGLLHTVLVTVAEKTNPPLCEKFEIKGTSYNHRYLTTKAEKGGHSGLLGKQERRE